MTQSDHGSVAGRSSWTRRSNAPSRCSPNGSATSSRPSTICWRRRSPRPYSNRGSVGTSSTGPPTAANAGGRASSPTTPRTGLCSAGTSARGGASRATPTQTSEVEVRFVAESPAADPPGAGTPAHRPARPRLGGRQRRRRRRRGLAACTWPATRRSSRAGELMTAIVTTTEVERPAAEVFAYATDPTRFSEWQKGVVDGHMDQPRPAHRRCPVPDHPPHWRRRTAVHLPGHTRRPTPGLGRARRRRPDPGDRRPHRRTAYRPRRSPLPGPGQRGARNNVRANMRLQSHGHTESARKRQHSLRVHRLDAPGSGVSARKRPTAADEVRSPRRHF